MLPIFFNILFWSWESAREIQHLIAHHHPGKINRYFFEKRLDLKHIYL